MRPAALLLLALASAALSAQDKPDGPSLPSLISLHTQALGGTVKLAELTNLRYRGTIEQDGAKYPFNVWKRRPSQVRIEVETSQGRLVQANDGKRLWRQAPFLNDGKVTDLDFTSARLMRMETTFESPLLSIRDRAARVTYLGEVPAKPAPHWAVQIDQTDGSRAQIFLDSRTHLMARMLWKEKPDATNELEMLYSDYRKVQDLPFAHLIETKLNGETVSTVRIELVIINPGAVTTIFSPPRPGDEE